jgi:hypothetical protein
MFNSASLGEQGARRRARWVIAGIVAALVLGAAVHRLTVVGRIDQTAALFIGVPATIALVVAWSGPARSATSLIFKVMTVALMLAGIVLGEGLICLLMAAPLFYLVGWMVGATVDAIRSRRAGSDGHDRRSDVIATSLLAVPLLAMTTEGLLVSFPRHETVVAERIVALAPEAVEAALAQPPRVGGVLPAFLSIGFPRPVAAAGTGLAVGDRRSVSFVGRKAGAKPRDLTLEVVERAPGYVRFRAVGDRTKIAEWLRWDEAEVTWEPVESGTRPGGTSGQATRVTWTLRYARLLDPAWYFAPLERYATTLAADYLIGAHLDSAVSAGAIPQ